ncbi:TonB-dependent receptor [Lutimonas halocynthiae]|uniref:TonB-dependent receptor plug domain-containing protein n=1 Tax=Lutimonas halocynthiae TaxID=1446477 RepID=UPI0025B29395|nr:TonB-dependent receptor [Lutimonas halocynthiae]MDN3643681.1 TonB-dependent receptor [Lutimonas halocynthiae]
MRQILFLLLLTFQALFAQDDSINNLDEIVLKGNFSPAMNSGYEVQVIADSILKDSYESLGNLLQKQANFYFKQNGNGMVSSISLRGTSASQTGVYWNGISINSALNGQTDFNTLQGNSFDELEVRKGGGSVLLGNGSIGGAINLKDKVSFKDRQSAFLLAGGGSYETYFSQLTAIWGSDQFYGKISGGIQSSVNDYQYGGTDLKNENGDYKNYNFNATLGFKINDYHSISLNASVFDNDRNLSRTLSAESLSNLESKDRRFLLEWKYVGDRVTSSFKTAFLHEDFTYLFNKNIADNASYGESERFIAKYDFSYFLNNKMFFRSGIEFENAVGNGSSISTVTRNDATAYFLLHHEPFERFMYNVSFRVGGSSAYEIPFIYSLDAKYALADRLSLRGAFSTNYRLPTFNDLYWEPGGNPDLKPENSVSGELGLDYKKNNFYVGGAAYFIQSEDLIQWRPVTQDFWQPQNVSDASNFGLEFSTGYNWIMGAHNFGVSGKYDYSIAQDDALDKQLIYVPKHRAGGALDYSWKKWRFNYNLQYVGEVFITTSNSQSLDAYSLSDISIYRTLFKQLVTLGFKVNNLFNENYQSVAFRPMPGRNYLLQINFKI